MGVFSGSFFKWVSHPFLCDVQITKWPFSSVRFPRKEQRCTCRCTSALAVLNSCILSAGTELESLLSTFRLCALQAVDKEVLKHWSGSGGIQSLSSSEHVCCCQHLLMTSMRGTSTVALAPQAPIYYLSQWIPVSAGEEMELSLFLLALRKAGFDFTLCVSLRST